MPRAKRRLRIGTSKRPGRRRRGCFRREPGRIAPRGAIRPGWRCRKWSSASSERIVDPGKRRNQARRNVAPLSANVRWQSFGRHFLLRALPHIPQLHHPLSQLIPADDDDPRRFHAVGASHLRFEGAALVVNLWADVGSARTAEVQFEKLGVACQNGAEGDGRPFTRTLSTSSPSMNTWRRSG